MREVPQRLASPSEETPLKKKKKKRQILLQKRNLNNLPLGRAVPHGNTKRVIKEATRGGWQNE